MTLSRQHFNEQCLEFVKLCQDYGDTWYLMGQDGTGRFKELCDQDSAGSSISHDELILVKTEPRSCVNQAVVRSYEYNVTYNESYEVPVMHFSVSDQAGCPVEAEEIDCLKSKDLSKVVSQIEHPLLFRPFYMIHPCRTEELMQIHHNADKAGYLISWLSFVGSLIDLKLDLRLSLSCETQTGHLIE